MLADLGAARIERVAFWPEGKQPRPPYNPILVHVGMTRKIAARLPDDKVKFVDHLVEAGLDKPRGRWSTIRSATSCRSHTARVRTAADHGAAE